MPQLGINMDSVVAKTTLSVDVAPETTDPLDGYFMITRALIG